MLEAIESYHAEHVTLPLVLGSFIELQATHELIDPHYLVQYADRPYDKRKAVLWVEGYDLMHESQRWVPFDVVHADFTLPHRAFPTNTNGLASGNHLLEAICHGLLEVIERDSLTLWERRAFDQKATTRVDTTSIEHDEIRLVLRALHNAGVACALWNITSDIGVPSYFCKIWDKHEDGLSPMYMAGGSGCHTDVYIAMFRSITEAVQSRLTAIAGSRDDLRSAAYHNRTPDALGLHPTPTAASMPPSGIATTNFNDDLNALVDHVAHAGLTSIIVVPLTKEEFGIPVVRVIIPGLESATISPEYTLGGRALREACAP